jgi:glycosyltransferase involved in cell wall biosynthesis
MGGASRPGLILLRVTPVSAVLITHNEERNLAAALQSVRFCDEVVVVDSGSTDRTLEVAEEAGARVIRNAPWPGFVAQRNLAAGAARNDWILAVDADERVSAELRDEIQAARAAGFRNSGYRIPRVARYMGRWIRATDWYPDPQLRLFDRTKGRWEGGLVHESVRVQGSVGRLRSELQHHPYDDIGHHLRKIDSYTSLWAREAFAGGRRAGALEAVGAAGWAFLRNYVLKGGFLLGEAGLTISLLNTHYTHANLAKLRELMRADGRAR